MVFFVQGFVDDILNYNWCKNRKSRGQNTRKHHGDQNSRIFFGEAKANYLAAAREKTWERMNGLMAEQPGGTANYDRLIELFYDLDAAK